ncbi:hypothetical protein ACLI4Z_09595 [Natrialbaceae archaeon A-arb3/5]
MPETEQQDRSLSELVVKEAVEMGLDTPMRESILEAVEESEGKSGGRLPIAGATFGLGAAIGFLAGRQSSELDRSSFEDIEEPEIVEDVMEESTEETTEPLDEGGEEPEPDGSSTLPRILLVLGVLAAIAVARRQLSDEDEEEWEPIEEFEPATSVDMDDESDEETADAEMDDADSTDEEEEE